LLTPAYGCLIDYERKSLQLWVTRRTSKPATYEIAALTLALGIIVFALIAGITLARTRTASWKIGAIVFNLRHEPFMASAHMPRLAYGGGS
jgi:hypothetical protein